MSIDYHLLSIKKEYQDDLFHSHIYNKRFIPRFFALITKDRDVVNVSI